MGERFIVKVWTDGQKHGFCQADIHFNSGITPRQLCSLGWLIQLSKPLFLDLYDSFHLHHQVILIIHDLQLQYDIYTENNNKQKQQSLFFPGDSCHSSLSRLRLRGARLGGSSAGGSCPQLSAGLQLFPAPSVQLPRAESQIGPLHVP